MPNVLSENMMNMIKKRMTMDETDESAFDSMQSVTKGKASNLFTESEYNVNATHEERMDYDLKAYGFLQELFEEDKSKKPSIKDWDFKRYLSNLKGSYLSEKFLNAKEGDPDYYNKAGDMLRSVYSDDTDQLILSASNLDAQILPEEGTPAFWNDPYEVRAKRARKRSNVSIKAPGAERY